MPYNLHCNEIGDLIDELNTIIAHINFILQIKIVILEKTL